jgi:hypothetical protein
MMFCRSKRDPLHIVSIELNRCIPHHRPEKARLHQSRPGYLLRCGLAFLGGLAVAFGRSGFNFRRARVLRIASAHFGFLLTGLRSSPFITLVGRNSKANLAAIWTEGESAARLPFLRGDKINDSGGSEDTLAGGTESSFCRWSRFFRDFAARQQHFEIDASELASAVQYEDLR